MRFLVFFFLTLVLLCICLVYRALTSPFFHLGILHLVMNMMAFLPMATAIERKQGSLSLVNLVLSFSLLNGLFHVIISLALYYSSLYKTRTCR